MVAGLARLLEQTLREAKRSVESWGGQLYFVYLPARARYNGKGPGPNPDRDIVLASAEAVSLPIVDLAEAFSASRAGPPRGMIASRTTAFSSECA
jgi:hypothetical protein